MPPLSDAGKALLRDCPFNLAVGKVRNAPTVLRKVKLVDELQKSGHVSGKIIASDHLTNTMRISLRRAGYEALGRDVPKDVVS